MCYCLKIRTKILWKSVSKSSISTLDFMFRRWTTKSYGSASWTSFCLPTFTETPTSQQKARKNNCESRGDMGQLYSNMCTEYVAWVARRGALCSFQCNICIVFQSTHYYILRDGHLTQYQIDVNQLNTFCDKYIFMT